MRNDSTEILSLPVSILINTNVKSIVKNWIFFFRFVKIYFAGTDYKSARSGHLISALDKNEYEDKSVIANINYLVAEMERRIGNFDEAIKYYDVAINDSNKQDWVEEVAKEQKELAVKKDENNTI
ncbi:DUF2225 domain-containing protein [Flavobacterium aquidurense]|uniref:DUF2225 domain-containing protein n=1 Tax=Flavobacterium aquidurense TaxID=362413 RepID=UPI000920C281|nr:DUF2225 domain-containing protein [Flavobacterium aquidurense]SHF93167.1 hypothetical protein SAMN05444481_101144 [Flavobacterium frigidimaris]